jgi:hypothetical protein
LVSEFSSCSVSGDLTLHPSAEDQVQILIRAHGVVRVMVALCRLGEASG